jgi:exodeoxyribonuclease-3
VAFVQVSSTLGRVKLISWNVNGLRSVLRAGALDAVFALKPDVVCLQEVKCTADDVTNLLPIQYHAYINPAERKGYAGTAILSKREPLRVTPHIGIAAHDSEGRVQTAEFDDFFLVNVYVPNSKRDLSRLPYRQVWDRDFLKYMKRLERRKPVIFCGDLNVAHTELDLTYPKANRKNHGFTDEERAGFDAFVRAGFLDTFREFEPAGGHYTWWSVATGARARNIGWRIDYFLVSQALRPRLKRSSIYDRILGSDHCPVGIELK